MNDWLAAALALLSLFLPLALAWWLIERMDRHLRKRAAHNRPRRWLRPASRPREDR